MKNYFLLLIFSLVMFGTIQAQTFTNQSTRLANPNLRSGVCLGASDMNGDGFDDLVRLSSGNKLIVEYQAPNSSNFIGATFMDVSSQSQWGMSIGDVDNNGFNDIMCGGSYDGVKIIKANAIGTDFTMVNAPSGDMFTQNPNFCDANNDGWIDMFVCHDDDASRLWINDGAGNYPALGTLINFNLYPTIGDDSGNSGNYGSIWTDFDNDGDVDLYIAKCRQGVNSPTDVRRINLLFENNGDGTYFENAGAHGLASGAQSWTADFGDVDNDGDFDLFLTNHDVPSQLLINDGNGNFSEAIANGGINVTVLPIEASFRDFDNDGFVDLLVTGSNVQYFKNNGNGTFAEVTDLFDNSAMESFALGDFNHDGFLDVLAGYAAIYTSPSNTPDKLWLNTPNGNNFLNVSVRGNTSTRNALGTRLELYGPWGVQIREVRAGESYGTCHTFAQNFGMGTALVADSLVIHFPSGQITRQYAINANQFINIQEGVNCTLPSATITANVPTTLCQGQSVLLNAEQNDAYTYQWSNGETTASILVTQAGVYNVMVSDTAGCAASSNSILVTFNPIEIPIISNSGENLVCAGEIITLSSTPVASGIYNWSNGATTQTIQITSSGNYTVTTQGLCQTFTSEPINITVLPQIVPSAVNDTLQAGGGDANLLATGASHYRWYGDDCQTLLDTAALFTPFVTVTDTFWLQGVVSTDKPDFTLGLPEFTGGNAYNGSTFNGEMYFTAHKELVLESVRVFTEYAGVRIIELKKASDNSLVSSKSVDIQVGTTDLVLDFLMPAGDYYLTTNSNSNQTVFGMQNPRLKRNNSDVSYPYLVSNLMDITGSNGGAEFYYYFYNWKIHEKDLVCESACVPVIVHVGTVGVEEINLSDKIQVQPNPTSSNATVIIPSETAIFVKATLSSVVGQVVKLWDWQLSSGDNSFVIDMASLPQGVYTLTLTGDKIFGNKKIVLVR